MAGTVYTPIFSHRERRLFFGNNKVQPIDREDRFRMDNCTAEILWSHKKLREKMVQKAKWIRELTIGLEDLSIDTDLLSKTAVFVPKRLYVGVKSSYLMNHPKIAESIEKLIYQNFLLPLGLSYDFYPFFEHLVLYGRRSSAFLIPNPNLLSLLLTKKKELGRNRYTASDRKFLTQQARLIIGATHRRSSPKQARDLHHFAFIFEALKSTKRPPRHLETKLICFFIFNDMQTDVLNMEREKGEEKRNKFLAVAAGQFLAAYYRLMGSDLGSDVETVNMSDAEAYRAVKKHYQHYKKLAEIL
jgi:hypothetical protein